jgi:signal transduction histidine kinase
MLIGRDLRVLIANRRFSEMLDLPPDLVSPGCPLADIVAWQVQAGEFGDGPVPSANRQSLAPAAAAAIHVYDRVRPNGVILRIRTDPLPDGGYVRSFTDVTESSRAAAAIAAARDAAEAAQAALAAALLNVQHGVMLTGADNRLLLINARAIDLLGLPLELSTPGTKGEDILRFQIARGDLGDVEQTTLAALASFEQQRSVSDHAVPVEVYQRTTYDGRFVEIRVTLLPDQRTLRTYTDITAHRTALRAEADARRAAEAALRSRTEFLAVVSHELRTPLNGIIGINGLLLSASPTPAQVSDLRLVEEAGKQLLAIVDDILRVTQLERGRLVLHEQRFDPRALLRGTAALMLPRAEAKGLHLDLRIDAALPLYVIGDEERLRETLLKLLGNAVKFTETGSITVSADIIAQDTAGCRIAISVADTGIGMLPETMARLFQPFVQADSSNQRRFGGLGLAWRSAA